MKKIFYIFTAISLLTLIACEHINYQSVTVIKDCTGAYLRLKGKDYQICNDNIVATYSNGVEIKAVFERTDSCNNSHDISCAMYHQNEGWINVTKIE